MCISEHKVCFKLNGADASQQAPEGADVWAVWRKGFCFSIVSEQKKLRVKADSLELNHCSNSTSGRERIL